MGAKFIINNKRYIEAYDNTNDMNKPYIRTKKAIKNHSIIDKNYYIKIADNDNDGDKTNNAKIYSRKKKKTYYLVTNIIPKRDFTYTDPSTGEVFSGLYRYGYRKLDSRQGGSGTYWIHDAQLLQKYKDELTNIKPIGSAAQAFSHCFNMIDLKGVESTWDTSEITDMSDMFVYFGSQRKETVNDQSQYKKIELDMTNWNFSNVTSMDSMFSGCAGLRKLYLPEQGIVAPKLTEMHAMFNNATSLEEIPMITTGQIKDMAYMFSGQIKITSMPQWDTSNVETMERMFQSCGTYVGTGSNPRPPYGGIKRIPSLNTSKVKNFEGTFLGCYGLEEIGELDTSSAEYMGAMFISCRSLPEEFPWVIDCSSINKLEEDAVGAKGMYHMFSNSSVKKVRLKNLKNSLKKTESSMASYLGTTKVIYEN